MDDDDDYDTVDLRFVDRKNLSIQVYCVLCTYSSLLLIIVRTVHGKKMKIF